MQRFHADNGNERLHRVVGEHAAAAAVAGAGFAGNTFLQLLVRITGHLKAGDDVDRLIAVRVGSRSDGAVGHDDGRSVVLEDGGEGADRRLVARDHRDGALQAACAQMLTDTVVCDLAADQRVTHLAGAVAHAVGGRDGVFGLHQPHRHLARLPAQRLTQTIVNHLDLALHTQITLAVAFVADDADRRLVDQLHVGAELSGDAIGLRAPSRVGIDQDGLVGFLLTHDAYSLRPRHTYDGRSMVLVSAGFR